MYLGGIFLLVFGWELAAAWRNRVAAHTQRNLRGLVKVAVLSAAIGLIDISAFLLVVMRPSLLLVPFWVVGTAAGAAVGVWVSGDVG